MKQRRGLGKGTGKKGYYNMLPMDSHIHSLSAKGVKTKAELLKKYPINVAPRPYGGEIGYIVMNPSGDVGVVYEKKGKPSDLQIRAIEKYYGEKIPKDTKWVSVLLVTGGASWFPIKSIKKWREVNNNDLNLIWKNANVSARERLNRMYGTDNDVSSNKVVF